MNEDTDAAIMPLAGGEMNYAECSISTIPTHFS